MATAVYYSDACLEHDTGGHPESAARLVAIMKRLRSAPDLDNVSFLDPGPADLDLVKRVHTPAHVDGVIAVAERGGGWLDADTVVSSDSVDAALHAVGGAVEAAVAVATGKLDSAFVAVRPPGHHATTGEAMGFCLFNNVAVAARHLLDAGLARRIALVDFDVHHGNGTQDIFYDEPDVLYFSTHQSPLYPGTGRTTETGRGAGEGYTVNVPLPPGTGDDGYSFVLAEVLTPLLRRYRPDVLLVSAGYDPHWKEQLASMRVTVPGFRRMVAQIKVLADELCGGRVAATLEGGYDLEALPCAVEATVRELSGSRREVADPYGSPPHAGGPAEVAAVVEAAKKIHRL